MSIKLCEKCDQLRQIIGMRDHWIGQLERAIFDQQQRAESAAREWNRLVNHQKELADWLIETATDEAGKVIKPRVDAGLGGESFIPCSCHRVVNGCHYEIELVSTEFEIRMVRSLG